MNAFTTTFPKPVTLAQAPAQGYDARALIPDGVKTQIHLDGQVYTLRITKAGKLILTK